jgi:penicillin-binding protein 1A
MGLGSSGVTLFEMTKAFSELGRSGRRMRPIVIQKVVDRSGKVLVEKLSLDKKFEKEIEPIDKQFEEKRQEFLANRNQQVSVPAASPAVAAAGAPTEAPSSDLPIAKYKTPHLYFDDPDQLISPETAYLITSILKGVIFDEGGTAGRARALNRPAAGKTGTTNGYYDTWFIGFTPQIATGVWVGFDQEKTLGVGEAGGKTALPIWLEYMKVAHKNLPVLDFPKPENIVFANIDNKTGKLASSTSTKIVHQAFLRGTEPKTLNDSSESKSDAELIKEDLSE